MPVNPTEKLAKLAEVRPNACIIGACQRRHR